MSFRKKPLEPIIQEPINPHSVKQESDQEFIDYITSPQYKDDIPDFQFIPLSIGTYQTPMSNEKIGLIKEIPFEQFCLQNFRNHTSWGLKLPLAEVMSFSHSSINKSLTRLPSALNKKAKSTFRCILIYLKQRSSSKSSKHYVKKLIKIGMESPESLCDEIYCQLVKQSNNNPKQQTIIRASSIRAWKLFGVCAGLFPPSYNLRMALLNHLVKVAENEDQKITMRANYCATKIEKVFENGKRLVIPSQTEIKYAKHMKPMPVSVSLLSGANLVIPVQSNDSASDLKIAILRRMRISVPNFCFFGIYEFCQHEGIHERYIEENEIIMDIISGWGDSEHFRLVLKLRMINKALKDSMIAGFLYQQKSFEIVEGILPLSVKDAQYLGSLKLLIDRQSGEKVEFIVNSNLEKYIPERLINFITRADWVRRLLSKYYSLALVSKKEARKKYLEHIAEHCNFGATFFQVEYNESEYILGVDESSVSILDMTLVTFVVKAEYKNISRWAFGRDYVGFMLVRGGNQAFYLVRSVHARTIERLIMDYVGAYVGWPTGGAVTGGLNARILGLSRKLMTRIAFV